MLQFTVIGDGNIPSLRPKYTVLSLMGLEKENAVLTLKFSKISDVRRRLLHLLQGSYYKKVSTKTTGKDNDRY